MRQRCLQDGMLSTPEPAIPGLGTQDWIGAKSWLAETA
jgi:hypothetical protein